VFVVASYPQILVDENVGSITNFSYEPLFNKGKALIEAFHIIDPFCEFLYGFHIKSMRVSEGKYFSFITYGHNPNPSIIPKHS